MRPTRYALWGSVFPVEYFSGLTQNATEKAFPFAAVLRSSTAVLLAVSDSDTSMHWASFEVPVLVGMRDPPMRPSDCANEPDVTDAPRPFVVESLSRTPVFAVSFMCQTPVYSRQGSPVLTVFAPLATEWYHMTNSVPFVTRGSVTQTSDSPDRFHVSIS